MISNFFYDVYTVFWRDWVVFKKIFFKFLCSRMITPFLYIFAFGIGLGKNVSVDGGSYLNFLIPGMIALNSMNISFNTIAAPWNMFCMYPHTLETYLISPISGAAFVFGKILSGTVRGLISSVVIVIIAELLGVHLYLGDWFIPILILNCFVFASLAVVAAMTIDSHEEMSSFSTYVLVPMSFLCGTFFKADSFPTVIKGFLSILPLTPASSALRASANKMPIEWYWPVIMFAYFFIFFSYACHLLKMKKEE